MEHRYWAFTAEQGTRLLTVYRLDIDNEAQTLATYCIRDGKWIEDDYIWTLLAEMDFRLDEIDEETAKQCIAQLIRD